MAIDPTTPLTPILPAVPAGSPPDSLTILQAMARQALANTTAQLGEIVGRGATPQAPATAAPVEPAGQAATRDAAQTQDASGAAKRTLATPQTLSGRPALDSRMAQAVRVAAAEAVPRQSGLAPLMANVRAALDNPAMPPEVREAGRALLAGAPPAADIATPAGLRRAVEQSGVFLEARMARAPAATSETSPASAHGGDMKAALLVFRGVLSAWLARATSSIPDAAEEALPEAATEAAEAKPEHSTPSSSAAAAARSSAPTPGRPLAAPLPSLATPHGKTAEAAARSVSAPPAEVVEKAMASAVTDAAPNAEAEPLVARFGAFITPRAAPNPNVAASQALSPLIQAGLLAEDAVADEPPAAPLIEAKIPVTRGYGTSGNDSVGSKLPPPPYAGGPMAGQKPAPSAMSSEQSPVEIVRGMLKGAGGALARQDLLQIASLPEPQHHGEGEAGEVRPHGARLNLDLPFVTPRGVAVAQFEISHDGGGSAGGAAGPAERTYKARFSIDVEPLGPVHAMVTLTGARTRVSLWAERAETIARLRAGEESLGAALRQAELTPEVAVHSGAPPMPGGANPLGHFVDQAS